MARSTTTTSSPAWRRYQALVTPITPDPRIRMRMRVPACCCRRAVPVPAVDPEDSIVAGRGPAAASARGRLRRFTQYRNGWPVYCAEECGDREVYCCRRGHPERDVKRKGLERIDRRVLKRLAKGGRISFTELGERVGLSTTPCTERVRRMEEEGTILGYHARLNPDRIEAGLLVFVELNLSYKSADIFEEFRRAALQQPQILECHLVSGDFDYLIKARIDEMASYRKLLGDILLTLPHVRESKSYIVMEEVKETAEIPVPNLKPG